MGKNKKKGGRKEPGESGGDAQGGVQKKPTEEFPRLGGPASEEPFPSLGEPAAAAFPALGAAPRAQQTAPPQQRASPPQQQTAPPQQQTAPPQQQTAPPLRQTVSPPQQQAASPPPQAAVAEEEPKTSGPPAKWKGKEPFQPYVTQEVNIEKSLATMKVKEDCHGSGGMLPPEKRRTGAFPGTQGTPCLLEANHFSIQNVRAIKAIHQYSIRVEPPWKRTYSKRDSDLYREIFHKWTKICPEIRRTNKPHWDYNYNCAFNGNNIFYSTNKITAKIPDIEGIELKECPKLKFNVRDVVYTQTFKVTEEMQKYLTLGRKAYKNQGGGPQDVLNSLDVILQQAVKLNKLFTTVGRSYFHQDGQVLDVGFGKEVWIGTFTSVRPNGWKEAGRLLTLNADVANKPATKQLHLTNESRPNAKDSYIHRVLCQNYNLNFSKGLTFRDFEELQSDLKGLKVRYELPNGNKRSYKVNKMVKSPRDMIIPDLKQTVEQYFKKEHKVTLKYPMMPCLHLGSISKTIYIPVEFCMMEKQPLPKGKKLQDKAVALMIRGTATKPPDRRNKILEGLQKNNEIYAKDPFAQEFGISFESKMAKINGRILAPPSIGYQGYQKSEKSVVHINPREPGSWRPRPNQHLYVNGMKLDNWAVLDLCGLHDQEYHNVIQAFVDVGREVGISITNKEDNLWHQRSNEGSMEGDFENVVHEYKSAGLKLELIMVIFPVKGGFQYDRIKHLGDIVHKIPTQCVLKNTLFKQGQVNRQVVSNLCLKMNSKLGGVNHVLSNKSRPSVLKQPIMIMGADVSHAAPESKGEKPSIAAIVGSMDPCAAKYECEVRIQKAEQNEEIIQDMESVTKDLLMKFHKNTNGRKPSQIIMFRDGVSEGQFLKVLAYELGAMRKACYSIEPNWEPRITYLVVQKRHHTRLFAADKNQYQRNQNVLAGTVVDQGLNHPTEGDFYLVSHEGIQGTSRPTHYQVLWDDADMRADDLEQLTYYLCHLYSRCTRSVSYPSPTYYSHLAADRARKHHNDMLEKGEREEVIKHKLETGDVDMMYFV